MTPTPKPRPAISVIIPVHNASQELDRCLSSLRKSTFKNYECIVAERYGCKVVRLRVNSGPAAARNRGVGEAAGEILYFVDSDVCVAPDSVQRVADRFEQDPDLDAMIGSYDDEPGEPDFLSQYRNLFHHFVHQHANEEATTFWSGCGAIRRSVLAHYGGFSEVYKRPAVEDIELGYRMRADGCKMRLDKGFRVKHLKRWTFWNILKTDIVDRGIPWTELILRRGYMPSDLNLRITQRISTALVQLLVLSTLLMVVYLGAAAIGPLTPVCYLVAANYWLFQWQAGGPRVRRAIGVIGGLAVSLLVAYGFGLTVLVPPMLLGLGMLLLQYQFLRPYRERPVVKALSVATSVISLACGLYMLSFLPFHPLVVLSGVLLALVLILNVQLYVFLARRHDLLFALTAVPFHLLYYLSCAVSFAAGTLLHWMKKGSVKSKSVRHPATTIE